MPMPAGKIISPVAGMKWRTVFEIIGTIVGMALLAIAVTEAVLIASVEPAVLVHRAAHQFHQPESAFGNRASGTVDPSPN